MKKILISFIILFELAACNQKIDTDSSKVNAIETDSSVLNHSSESLTPGPDLKVKITESYARQVARDAYSIIYFPNNLLIFLKNIFTAGSKVSIQQFTQLIVPILFFYFIFNLIKSSYFKLIRNKIPK